MSMLKQELVVKCRKIHKYHVSIRIYKRDKFPYSTILTTIYYYKKMPAGKLWNFWHKIFDALIFNFMLFTVTKKRNFVFNLMNFDTNFDKSCNYVQGQNSIKASNSQLNGDLNWPKIGAAIHKFSIEILTEQTKTTVGSFYWKKSSLFFCFNMMNKHN